MLNANAPCTSGCALEIVNRGLFFSSFPPVLQVLRLRYPETRAELRRGRLPWRVCALSCTVRYTSTEPLLGGSDLEAVPCLPLRRYVEFPVRRCRNLAKPSLDLQQGCNRGPCQEFPRTNTGRITTTALVSGWYSSPWHQVQCYPSVHLYVGAQHAHT